MLTTCDHCQTYLNAGMGEPCAGQVRANGSSAFMRRVEDFEIVENFGIALPIGSV